MAGRGRGRGRGQMTFNVEAVGIGKGDALPPPTLQPSPLFPVLERRAAPLPGGEEGEYMLALKQELRRAMKGLPYFVKPGAPRRDIERYSDKYQLSSPVDNAIDWNPDWRRLPRELRIRVRRPRRGRTPGPVPKQQLALDKEEAIKKLEGWPQWMDLGFCCPPPEPGEEGGGGDVRGGGGEGGGRRRKGGGGGGVR
ncbi:DNA-directed RNA polymerase III subunit RPC7-like isoform X2 [Molothrus aeneus]|uniref:DNA-directed RNA polymerase III subunit RPC7-like isoform X2 n=1 Tax=Molothrus ater TaxID=84834 RepID=UPI0023E8BFE5|nr:DNA-directed RNA polymerase III subunit RPC7-like isoform X2 [Molothrus ater]